MLASSWWAHLTWPQAALLIAVVLAFAVGEWSFWRKDR